MTGSNASPQSARPVWLAALKGWRLDLLIAVAVLIGSATWATQFWNNWTTRGGSPEFYQIYFEPAVMIACGKGFVISEQQPKVLEDFLWRRRDTLGCAELPADLKLGRNGLYQEAWTYLQYTVGYSWRVLGISWSGMGPLFGLFFGAVTALAFAIFRLGMGRALALACVAGLTTSSMQLVNLPHLRDYSKAPFTLALVLILGLLVTRKFAAARVLLLSAAYGTVLGLGYGFRTDLLINLPVLVVTLFLFLDGGLTRNLVTKVAATALFLVSFIVVSWPITSAVYTKGGCQWHVAVLGLQSPFEQNLGVRPAPYDFGYVYGDGYVISSVQGFAQRLAPDAPPPPYCGHEYDGASGRYLVAIATSFPGDMVTRAYASMFQIVELPFLHLGPPAGDWNGWLFSVRQRVLAPRHAWGLALAAVTLILASIGSIRIGLFLLLFLAYFGGYPAVQFQERHYFHLEFVTWAMLGFVAQQLLIAVMRNGLRLEFARLRALALRPAIVAVTGAVVLGTLLGVTRWYQQGRARALFNEYIAAPKVAIDDPYAGLSGAIETWPQFIEIELTSASCGPAPSVTFKYDTAAPDRNFTKTIAVAAPAGSTEPARVFLPVFEGYRGVEVANASPGCRVTGYRLTSVPAIPLLLTASLPPGWQDLPLYQRLARWEGN